MKALNPMDRPEIETQIYIVGHIELQNILLSHFIEGKTGFKCNYSQEVVPPYNNDDLQSSLVLWDYLNSDQDKIWALLDPYLKSDLGKIHVALFNVSRKQKILEGAIRRGINGMFYKNDSPLIIAKGVRAILNGELWFPRETLSKALSKQIRVFGIMGEINLPLTSREKEILAKLSDGSTNFEIADDLCINIHTVKTHLYNTYDKINVSSRLQASLWAARNL